MPNWPTYVTTTTTGACIDCTVTSTIVSAANQIATTATTWGGAGSFTVTGGINDATAEWIVWSQQRAVRMDDNWRAWVNQGRRQIEGAPNIRRKKTDEEVRAELRMQQVQAEWERRAREHQAAELAAQKKAEALLLSVLTEEQRRELGQRRQFFVTSKSGKRYRIDRHTHGNVYELNELGNPVRRLCAQPPGVPVDDAIAAQKLMLETDEAAFLRVANATRL